MKHPAADDNRITMAQEIELKLTLPESERRRFMRSPLLRTALIRDTGRLVNIYYDTPPIWR
jgi:inorganic triphosphatase YgiF